MGSPAIFAGQNVKLLKSNIDLNGNASILTGTNDPTSVATNAPEGSLYMRTSTGVLYVKQDNGSTTSWAACVTSATTQLPTIQSFTSGSGTYTTPAGVLYIQVEMVGGGGGGAGSGTSAGSAAGNGGNTTFGSSSANGGTAGAYAAIGGAGGTASLSGASGIALAGSAGDAAGKNLAATTGALPAGGSGGTSALGGAGSGGTNADSGAGPTAGITNSGSGGGGGGATNATANSGSGGGSGGYAKFTINSPSATYSYAVGAAGSAGGAGGGGAAQSGAAGGSGIIVVTEYYSPVFGAATGISRSINSVTSTVTGAAASATDYVYNLGSGAVFTMPTAVSNTNRYSIKNVDSSNKTVSFTGGQTADGSSSVTLTPNTSVELMSDGSNWRIY